MNDIIIHRQQVAQLKILLLLYFRPIALWS